MEIYGIMRFTGLTIFNSYETQANVILIFLFPRTPSSAQFYHGRLWMVNLRILAFSLLVSYWRNMHDLPPLLDHTQKENSKNHHRCNCRT